MVFLRSRLVCHFLRALVSISTLYIPKPSWSFLSPLRSGDEIPPGSIWKNTIKRQSNEIFWFFFNIVLHLSRLFDAWELFEVGFEFDEIFTIDSPPSFIAESPYSSYHLVRRIATLCIIYSAELLFKLFGKKSADRIR